MQSLLPFGIVLLAHLALLDDGDLTELGNAAVHLVKNHFLRVRSLPRLLVHD